MTGKNRPNKPSLHEDACLYYARELRSARAKVRERPEDFLVVAHAVEALGTSMGANPKGGFAKACKKLDAVFDLDADVQAAFERVRLTRNLAAHEGAIASRSAGAAIEITIALESAPMNMVPKQKSWTVRAWMARSVVLAEPWWTVAQARRIMIEKDFSALPIRVRLDGETCTGLPPAGGHYHLLRDRHIVDYLIRGGGAREHLLDVIAGEGLRSVGETAPSPEIELRLSRDEALELALDHKIEDLVQRPEWKSHQLALVTMEVPGLDPARRVIGTITPHDLLPLWT